MIPKNRQTGNRLEIVEKNNPTQQLLLIFCILILIKEKEICPNYISKISSNCEK